MKVANKLVRAYLKKYNRELDRLRYNALHLQQKQLTNILKSPFIKSARIDSFKAFQRLPPSQYSDYKDHINMRLKFHKGSFQKIKYFAKSAGTSSPEVKYIPTSKEYLRVNHVQASWFTVYLLYHMIPDMDVFSGKNLLVGGAVYENTTDHTIADISGLMIRNIPKQFHRYYVPTIQEATNPCWEEKLEITAQKAARDSEVVLFAGVPTWILTLSKEILDISRKSHLLEVWPHLKAYLHGGVKFDPYKPHFKELIPSKDFLYLEVYNASEGFIAVQDTRDFQGLLLLTNHGIYFEFISLMNYKMGRYDIINLNQIQIGVSYVLLISNISGLYRYVIGDTISFVSRNPFRIIVEGRISDYINAFGEDLTMSVANQAITQTLIKSNTNIRNYTVAPHYLTMHSKGRHQWFIEFEQPPENLSSFIDDLDYRIQTLNFNYKQKRSDNLAMEVLEIITLPFGFFDNFAKKHQKFGGQNKLPKLRNDRILANQILKELQIITSEILANGH